jgi:hypothetical protein
MHTLDFKNGRYYINRKVKVFGLTIYSEPIASYTDIEEAVKHFKKL